MLLFAEGGKPENPEKNPWSTKGQEATTNSTYMHSLNTVERVLVKLPALEV